MSCWRVMLVMVLWNEVRFVRMIVLSFALFQMEAQSSGNKRRHFQLHLTSFLSSLLPVRPTDHGPPSRRTDCQEEKEETPLLPPHQVHLLDRGLSHGHLLFVAVWSGERQETNKRQRKSDHHD